MYVSISRRVALVGRAVSARSAAASANPIDPPDRPSYPRSGFRPLAGRDPRLPGEGPELLVGHAALALDTVPKGRDERLLVLLRPRFREIFDQGDESQDLFRRGLDSGGSKFLGDGLRPGVLSEDERPLSPDSLGLNRLVRRRVLDDAVRVDAGLVGEGVVADQRLPDGHRDAAQPFDELG